MNMDTAIPGWLTTVSWVFLGIALFIFEYFFSTVPTRGRLSSGEGVGVALLIAMVTVLAFDVGMGGWMLVLHFVLFMPPPSDVAFVFLMQVGLILGFLTGYPAVLWLVRRGTQPRPPEPSSLPSARRAPRLTPHQR